MDYFIVLFYVSFGLDGILFLWCVVVDWGCGCVCIILIILIRKFVGNVFDVVVEGVILYCL